MSYSAFHLFGGGEHSATVKKIKQNVHALKENQVIQQAKIKEQYESINVTNIETAENHKPLILLSWDLVQLNCKFYFFIKKPLLVKYEKSYFK